MNTFRLSMVTSLILTILVVGLLGLGLAMVSTNVYRDVILDYKRDSLVDLIAIKSRDQLSELEEYSRDLGNSLKSSADFRQALARNDQAVLIRELKKQFHQYFVTAHVLRLERLIVLSRDFDTLAEASAVNTHLQQSGPVCEQLITQASTRKGSSRLRIISRLCTRNQQPYYSILLPLGGLVPTGYLEVITSPSHSLRSIAEDLGMPIRIRLPNDSLLFQSTDWPQTDSNGLTATYALPTTGNESIALHVDIYEDSTRMYSELRNIRNTLLLLSTAIIGVVILVALYLLRRTLVTPLEILNTQLQRLHTDNKLLGEPISANSSIIEINQLVDDFNQMAAELHDLYGRLERMAYTDPMTQVPNRELFNLYVDHLLGSQTQLALFLIDYNGFKAINDKYGHSVGDQLLCRTTERISSVLRLPVLSENDGISLARISNYDLLVRLGGDEFAVVLPGIESKEQVGEIADKLVEATRQPLEIDGNVINISVSIGIALYPEDGKNRSILLHHADDAMYQSKKLELDYCFYSDISSGTASTPGEIVRMKD